MKKNDLLTQLEEKFARVLEIGAVEPEIAGVRWYIANVLDTMGKDNATKSNVGFYVVDEARLQKSLIGMAQSRSPRRLLPALMQSCGPGWTRK